MYEKLSQNLYNTLLPLVGGKILRLERVEIQKPTLFPFVSVVEDDTTEDETVFDTVRNVAVYRYKVRVVHSVANFGTDTALSDCCKEVREVVDEILATIRGVKVWDECVVDVSTGVKWGYMNEENLRIADIGVSFRVVLDI